MRDIRVLFPTDDPVPRERMIGRRADVDDIASALIAGTNVVLAGPRRTGKTSVAEAALARAREAGLYTAAVDLFRRRDATDLAEGLAEAVLENRGPVRRLLRRAREAAGTLRDAASVTAVARLQAELGEAVELVLRPAGAPADPERALSAALELPERVAAADGRRLVLFLDEFQEVAGAGKPFGDADRLTKQMRAIFQRSPNVSFLFAGSIEHLMRDLFGPRERALSQFGSYRALSPIEPEEWRAGLEPRFAAIELAIVPEALGALIDAGEGHPRATMLIARETATAALAAGTSAVGRVEVAAGLELALAADRLRHEQALERIRVTRHAQGIAQRIARGEPPYAGSAPGSAYRALRALELAGVAERAARGRWRIIDPLLRRYLAALPGR